MLILKTGQIPNIPGGNQQSNGVPQPQGQTNLPSQQAQQSPPAQQVPNQAPMNVHVTTPQQPPIIPQATPIQSRSEISQPTTTGTAQDHTQTVQSDQTVRGVPISLAQQQQPVQIVQIESSKYLCMLF